MSIQAYTGPASPTTGAIVPVGSTHLLTPEEYEKRLQDAAELEEKLKFITEKIPTRIMNTAGSNAGAGSGEFHMYRMARRREQMRLARIEEAAREKELDDEFQAKQEKMKLLDEERTAKRRAKRLKKKAKKKRKAGESAPGGEQNPAEDGGDGGSSEDDDAVEPQELD